ncbi:uncharacterized protein [Dermacentor albipictus]|uniref:uncharacterized protein isoform X8 n=1 Tax=Dermacentor albipictus TaxID=60249 RepID=UPI0038FC5EB4
MQAAHFRETFQWLVVRTTRARTAGSSYVSQQTRSQPFRRRHNLTERMLAARACRTSPWLMVRTMGLTNSRAKFRFLGDKDFPVAHGPNNRGTNSRAKFRFERDKVMLAFRASSPGQVWEPARWPTVRVKPARWPAYSGKRIRESWFMK